MEQTTKYFILKDSGLHYIPDMPMYTTNFCKSYFKMGRCESTVCSCLENDNQYKEELKQAIASSTPVDNQEEVKQKIKRTHADSVTWDFLIGEIYPLECDVEIKGGKGDFKDEMGEEHYDNAVAFVKLKEETKENKYHECTCGFFCDCTDNPCSCCPKEKVIQSDLEKTTLKIMSVILEHQNGYTKQEIKDGNLAEDCIGSDIYDAILEVIKNI